MAPINLAALLLLLDVATRAIDLAHAENDAGSAKSALNAAYNEWKFEQGIEHVDRDTGEWDAMMLATAEPYAGLERAKRQARNAKNRLRTAVTKYEGREATA